MPGYSMRYSLVSEAAPNTEFTVITFSGREALSECYAFEIVAACPMDVELDDLMIRPFTFTVSTEKRHLPYHGVIVSLDQIRQAGGQMIFKAVLVPHFGMLDYSTHSQVFLDKSIPEIIQDVLRQRSITNFKMELRNDYPKRRFTCQYNETYFNFISRWMEYIGLYYFFIQEENSELLVITDSNLSSSQVLPEPLLYDPVSHLAESERHRAVTSWGYNRSLIPSSVHVKTYNYQFPSLDISGEKELLSCIAGTHPEEASGRETRKAGQAALPFVDLGGAYSYGEDFDSPSEGKILALVRSEELCCQLKVYSGKSFCPGLLPGHTFALEGHYQKAGDMRYLVTGVEHHGHQAGALPSSLNVNASVLQDKPDYQATLTAIPASVQFRARRQRTKPLIRGLLEGVVESEPGSRYAMLDNLGRYKVRLPFDLSDSPATKASCWLRKAEPYAGSGHGMHFPLQGGAQVLLGFKNGDIDRPTIVAAVHDAEALSQVTDKNPAANVIRTAGNNILAMGDRQGQEYILLHSPFHDSSIAIGSTARGGGGSITIKTKGQYESFVYGNSASAIVGSSASCTAGIKTAISLGLSNSITVGASTSASAAPYDISIYKGNKIALGTNALSIKDTSRVVGIKETVLSGGYQQSIGNLVSAANKALMVGMAGAALAAGAAQLQTDANEGGYLSDKGGHVLDNGIAMLAGAGVLACAAAQVSVAALAKSVEAAGKSTATTMFTLNKDGATLAVDSLIGPAAAIKLVQGDLPGGSTESGPTNSQLVMSGNGKEVTLTNMVMGKLSMKDGKQCDLSVLDGETKLSLDSEVGASLQTTTYKLQLTNSEAYIDGAAGFEMGLTEKHAYVTNPGKIGGLEVSTDTVMLRQGSAGIKITADQIRFFGTMMSISASGTVRIL